MNNSTKRTRIKRSGRRRKSGLKHHRRSIFLICAVLVFLSVVLAVGSVKLHTKNEQYKAQEKELEAQIKEEEERSEEVKEYQEYVKTDEYIKETAEDKLDLVDPNEITFKPAQ